MSQQHYYHDLSYLPHLGSVEENNDQILVPVANPKSGTHLIRMATILARASERYWYLHFQRAKSRARWGAIIQPTCRVAIHKDPR